MKKLSLVYGYSESLKNHDIFLSSLLNYNKTFSDFDTILHCWDDDPFLNEYIDKIKPIEVIISKQPDIKNYDPAIYTYSNVDRDKWTIIPRVVALQQLKQVLIKYHQYDVCCLRRFDLFFYKHLELIDYDKINLIRNFLLQGRSLVNLTSQISCGWGTDRLNDYLILTNYENMLRFLSFDMDDVIRYHTDIYNKIGKSGLKKDFHYFIAQRIKDVFGLGKINYFMNSPQDMQVAKQYYYDNRIINVSGRSWSINNYEKFNQLTADVNRKFEAL